MLAAELSTRSVWTPPDRDTSGLACREPAYVPLPTGRLERRPSRSVGDAGASSKRVPPGPGRRTQADLSAARPGQPPRRRGAGLGALEPTDHRRLQLVWDSAQCGPCDPGSRAATARASTRECRRSRWGDPHRAVLRPWPVNGSSMAARPTGACARPAIGIAFGPTKDTAASNGTSRRPQQRHRQNVRCRSVGPDRKGPFEGPRRRDRRPSTLG
jgi:hypothetical protein